MRKPRLATLALLAVLLHVVTAVAGAPSFDYTVTLAGLAKQQGVVVASGITWTCKANRCTTSGPWPMPGVSACAALAREVGPVTAYGHKGASLSADQLLKCNGAPPARAFVPPAPAPPAPSVSAPSVAPAAKLPPVPAPGIGGVTLPRTLAVAPPPPALPFTAARVTVVGRSAVSSVTAPRLTVVGRVVLGPITAPPLRVVGRALVGPPLLGVPGLRDPGVLAGAIRSSVTAPALVVVGRPVPDPATAPRLTVVGTPPRPTDFTSPRLVVVGQ
jgi:hypothetical protein